MAKDPKQERELHEIRQQIAHSRDRLGRDLEGLRYELDFPLKFRKSFQRNTTTWISALVLAGVVMTARATSRKKVYTTGKSGQHKKGEEQKKGMLQAGLAMGALRFATSMLRPVVISYVTQRFGGHVPRSADKRY
ncbi:MAG TPA: hypothetical protein VK993_11615 [Chthoniobacterales bacterium]|nr:hypothetical protein [Chthoniobacterales bacterium]